MAESLGAMPNADFGDSGIASRSPSSALLTIFGGGFP